MSVAAVVEIRRSRCGISLADRPTKQILHIQMKKSRMIKKRKGENVTTPMASYNKSVKLPLAGR